MHTSTQAQSVTKVDAYIGKTFNVVRKPSGLVLQNKIDNREYPITDKTACAWVEGQLNGSPAEAVLT